MTRMPISTVGGVPEKFSNRLVHSVLSGNFEGGPPINLREQLVHSVLSCNKSGNFHTKYKFIFRTWLVFLVTFMKYKDNSSNIDDYIDFLLLCSFPNTITVFL